MVSVLTIGTVTSTGTEMGSGTEKIVGARRSIDIIGVATAERDMPHTPAPPSDRTERMHPGSTRLLEDSKRGFQGDKILRSKV